jgi:tetraacyldisaccharide 4'-kinase
VRRRNRQYDLQRKAIERVGVPVISVGNLTLGGTGKTPLVEWICRWVQNQGLAVAIVSRGYKASPNAVNDEAAELAERLPGVPLIQNPDRAAGARRAIEEFNAQVIVLDDGFQHRRIARDLDIVLVDSTEPFGFEHVFPRGTLREPLAGLTRAHCVVLSRADMSPFADRQRIRARVQKLAPVAAWAESVHQPLTLRAASGAEVPLESLRGCRVAALAGIGNPSGFRHTLAACGYDVGLFREFPDHHAYPTRDIESLEKWAEQAEVAAVLCTSKDLVKIARDRLGDKPLWAVRIALAFTEGQSELEGKLRWALAPAAS